MRISKNTTVIKNVENPESTEIIADSIIRIAAAIRKLDESKLHKRAVLLLIRDMTNLSLSDIDTVLTAAATLDKRYIKQPKK